MHEQQAFIPTQGLVGRKPKINLDIVHHLMDTHPFLNENIAAFQLRI